MKVLWKISTMCAIFCTVLMSSCQIQQPAGTPSNGTAVTGQEKEQLDAMKPQVYQIINDVTGSDPSALTNGKTVSLEQANLIKDRVETLLQKQFGNDYQKFVIEKELTTSVTNVSESRNIYLNGVSQQIGYWTSTSSIPNYATQTLSHIYSLHVTVNTCSTPWFSFNYASQNLLDDYYAIYFNVKTGSSSVHTTSPFMAASQTIAIVDSGVQLGNTVYNTNGCTVVGLLVTGSYPKTAASITTYHSITDPNVYNGSVWYGWIWPGY